MIRFANLRPLCTRRHLPKISWSWKVKTNRAHELPRKIPGKTSSQSTSGNSWASQCDANWRSTMQQRDLRLSVKRRMKASSIDSTMTTLGDLSNLNSLLSTGLETKSTTTFEVQSGQIFEVSVVGRWWSERFPLLLSISRFVFLLSFKAAAESWRTQEQEERERKKEKEIEREREDWLISISRIETERGKEKWKRHVERFRP